MKRVKESSLRSRVYCAWKRTTAATEQIETVQGTKHPRGINKPFLSLMFFEMQHLRWKGGQKNPTTDSVERECSRLLTCDERAPKEVQQICAVSLSVYIARSFLPKSFIFHPSSYLK